MKLTHRENFLLRRALDKATTPAEAETAAKVFVASLRQRGASGYDFVPTDDAKPAGSQPSPPPKPSAPEDVLLLSSRFGPKIRAEGLPPLLCFAQEEIRQEIRKLRIRFAAFCCRRLKLNRKSLDSDDH